MSGAVGDRKRLVRLTAENLRERTIPLAPHVDFFRKGPRRSIKIVAEGLPDPIDVRLDPSIDEASIRGEAVARFLSRHDLHVGDILSFEKAGDVATGAEGTTLAAQQQGTNRTVAGDVSDGLG